METIQVKAYAKINLSLDVTGRRPNGYHDVRMIMQSIQLHDRITLKRITKNEIILNTNLSFLPTGKGNLVYDAAVTFFRETGIDAGVYIDLEKHIPVAAGMAGGSTDCAATLAGLNELFETKLSLEELQRIGVRLGADVPYCLQCGTALSEGIGEILTALPAPPTCKVLIVKPTVSVSTKFVYEHLELTDKTVHPDVDAMIEAIQTNDYGKMISNLGNVLQDVTIPYHPEIAEIQQTMLALGAEGALMSGSGPTVFGLFRDPAAASAAYYHFKVGSYGSGTFLTDFQNCRD